MFRSTLKIEVVVYTRYYIHVAKSLSLFFPFPPFSLLSLILYIMLSLFRLLIPHRLCRNLLFLFFNTYHPDIRYRERLSNCISRLNLFLVFMELIRMLNMATFSLQAPKNQNNIIIKEKLKILCVFVF